MNHGYLRVNRAPAQCLLGGGGIGGLPLDFHVLIGQGILKIAFNYPLKNANEEVKSQHMLYSQQPFCFFKGDEEISTILSFTKVL